MIHSAVTRTLQDQYIWSDIILSQAEPRHRKFFFNFLSVGLFIIFIKTFHDE
jgi:hypothetical protein